MAFTELSENLAFHQQLGDNPGSDNNLTAAELKAWFDKAPLVIQEYINGTLLPELETTLDDLSTFAEKTAEQVSEIVIGSGFLPTAGGSMSGDINMAGNSVKNLPTPTDAGDAVPMAYAVHKTETTVTLSVSAWSSLSQSVSVTGVTADNTVIVTPAPDSYTACLDAGAYCSGQGAGTLSFGCIKTPSVAVVFNVLILD